MSDTRRDGTDPEPGELLNARELEVLRLIAGGSSNQEIAAQLIISLNTVRWHIKHIYGKLGVHSRTLAIRKAYARGLLASDSPADPPARLLPPDMTPFIGRQADLHDLEDRLQDPACRLVTILAVGGTGKTRLALAAAATCAHAFRDGVVFVPLAPVQSAEMIPQAVASALRLRNGMHADTASDVLEYLSTRQMLLVMDNFEHVLDGAFFLSQMLSAAPGLRVVATSRQRLNLQAEWLYDLSGLATEPPSGSEMSEAASLFIACALRHKRGFKPDLAAINAICRTLGGSPLGIEMAAAWVRVLPLSEIAREIGKGFDFLSVSAADMPERHHSLRGVFDQSWALLSPSIQSILARLSVFWDGFTREAAVAVAGADLGSLAQLINTSLVEQHSGGRCSLHPVIRQYAAEKLDLNQADAEEVRKRHTSYFANRVQDLTPDLKFGEVGATVRLIDADIHNIRAALRWMIDHEETGLLLIACDGLGLYHTFSRPSWESMAHFDTLTAAMERLLARHDDQAARFVRASSWVGKAYVAIGRLDFASAEAILQPIIPSVEDFAEPWHIAQVLHVKALLRLQQGRYSEVADFLPAALELARTSRDTYVELEILVDIATAHFSMGEFDTARSYFDQADQVVTSVEGRWGQEYLQLTRIQMAYDMRRYDEVSREGRRLVEMGSDPWLRTLVLDMMGRAALIGGRCEVAGNLFNKVVQTATEAGELRGIINGRRGLGLVALRKGDLHAARTCFAEVLTQSWRVNDTVKILMMLHSVAELALALGSAEYAAEIVSAVMQHSACIGRFASDSKNLLDLAAANLPEGFLMAAIERGTRQELAQITPQVLDWLDHLHENELELVIAHS